MTLMNNSGLNAKISQSSVATLTRQVGKIHILCVPFIPKSNIENSIEIH